MYDSQTQGKKKGLCLHFVEKDLPMVLNTTNAETIAKVTGSDKLADWVGKKIIVGQSKIRAFGKDQVVIRVRDQKPQEDTVKKASKTQLKTIQGLIDNGAITNTEAMLNYYKVSKLEDLSEADAAALIEKKTAEASF